MSRHVESYSPAELRRFLEAAGGERRDGGSGHLAYAMPNGEMAPCPGHGQIVTILVAAKVADVLGITRQELTRRIKGAEPGKAGKIRKGVTAASTPAPSRRDVAAAIESCQSSAAAIKSSLRGQRDAEHYRRLLGPVLRAQKLLSDAEAAS